MAVPLTGLILAGYAQPHKTITDENRGKALDTVTVVGYGSPSQTNKNEREQQENTYKPVTYSDVISIAEECQNFRKGEIP